MVWNDLEKTRFPFCTKKLSEIRELGLGIVLKAI